LIHEKSPYLLQHAHNPVEWYPWGNEVIERARAEDRPIFLSIGYATCHWCHVMERESFENPHIAALLNEWFVPVKVDREERPDVDRIYMTAVQAMGIGGGWPLSVFLTPDLRPFYGGTYFPPESRYGRAGFPDVLRKIHELWEGDRQRLLESAEGITRFLNETPLAAAEGDPPGREAMELCHDQFRSTFDQVHGGFGRGPKFPRPAVLHFLLRHGKRSAVGMVTRTLERMASGGVADHVGGGFHRYAVDAAWRVPHFEKMLYDQAQLAVAYLEAFQLTRDPLYAAVARGTLEYVLRDMRDPDGGFTSAEDADSPRPEDPGESGEGAFYVWTRHEVMEALGEELGEVCCYAFDVREKGNVEHDPQGEFAGKNILYLPRATEDVAARFGIPSETLPALLDEARRRLLHVRNRRPRPLRDDKVLTSWNGLMIGAFALGARVLGEPAYADAARGAAAFIERRLVDVPTGRLMRRYRDGEARIEGQLDDYAFYVQGLIELYTTTGDPAYLRRAVELTEQQLELFGDPSGGGFFDTAGNDPTLLVRMKEHHDGAEPSGNSVAAWNLLRLAELTDRPHWRSHARGIFQAEARILTSQPVSLPMMTGALGFLHSEPHQVFIVGPAEDERTIALREELFARFLPHMVVHLVEPGRQQEALATVLPFAGTLTMVNGVPTAYVCRHFVCELPTTLPEELGKKLDEQ
jgi:uncharacterized protein YyaL (SSP411 family)